jgi:hypothetical protein
VSDTANADWEPDHPPKALKQREDREWDLVASQKKKTVGNRNRATMSSLFFGQIPGMMPDAACFGARQLE